MKNNRIAITLLTILMIAFTGIWGQAGRGHLMRKSYGFHGSKSISEVEKTFVLCYK